LPAEEGPPPLARFGPTTPTRARRLADASVDPTEDTSAQLPDAPRTCTYDA
jgi:hypothetical protein